MKKNKTPSERITIVLSNQTAQKVRAIQASVIKKKSSSYSFSRAIEDLVKMGLDTL
jgi:hypothetical protein